MVEKGHFRELANIIETLPMPPRIKRPQGRGLHSPTFQLNLSTLYAIGSARRGYVARVKGVLGGVLGV
jgi:hypothetical protein